MNQGKRSGAAGAEGGGAPKRARVEDDDVDALVNDDHDQLDDTLLDEEGTFLADPAAGVDVEDLEPGKNWPRPDAPDINPRSEDLVFQQVEIDYAFTKPNRSFVAAGPSLVPVVRIYGVTRNGNSCTAFVHGFEPYFLIEAPSMSFGPDECEELRETLNKAAQSKNVPGLDRYVTCVELLRRQSVWYYQASGPKPFLKIVVALPTLVIPLRSMLERGQVSLPGVGHRAVTTFESNVLFALRFMIDRDVVGCNWVELPRGKYTLRPKEQKLTTSQYEADVYYEDLVSHKPEGAWSDIAPLRVLSVDIECAGRKGKFPDAKVDPVIQIASHVTVQGRGTLVRNILTLGKCAPIVGAEVISFDNERDMLMRWHDLLVMTDADILIGYNIMNFDLPYLIDRAESLKIPDFLHWGRVKASKIRMRDTQFSSKAYGTRSYKEITIEGRVQLDMLLLVQRDYKLSSYSLNSVSAHFLGEQKEDVHHSLITDLQNGNDETRRRLAVYCLKDAYLPQRLFDKLMYMYNYTEMARVTGVPLSYLLSRGQSIKVYSQILRKCRGKGYVVPNINTRAGTEGVSYEGATVLEAKAGFYEQPVATLDFASLYPSIMMAHNLCYSTLVPKGQERGVAPETVTRTPSGDTFVKASVKPGVLPEILTELLAARKRARKEMAAESDEFKKAVLNGRQLALKVSANSVYGFTGATVGKMPCLEISGSVTAFGRDMIHHTKRLVSDKFRKENGYEHDCEVIYGDTDSVMVRFGTNDVKRAMELGLEAAQYVTATFIKPINLEFEKVYWPYLLISKKRYAGLLWTKPEKADKMDTKGIETVRRDNCELVRQVIDRCLQDILMRRDVKRAESYVKETISDLLMNRMDLSLLVVTKALSQEPEAYEVTAPHVELAKKMRKRDPATGPQVGDRIAYVIVKGPKNAKTFEKAEDPIFVLENNLPIDAQHYLEHHLEKPLMRIFEPIMKNPRELLTGEHTRNVVIATPSTQSGGIMKFAQKRLACLGCKSPLTKGEATVCDHCKPREAEIYHKLLTSAQAFEGQYAQLWTQCQRCQESLHQDVLCTSRDCPIFYRRKKVQKDISAINENLARFDDW